MCWYVRTWSRNCRDGFQGCVFLFVALWELSLWSSGSKKYIEQFLAIAQLQIWMQYHLLSSTIPGTFEIMPYSGGISNLKIRSYGKNVWRRESRSYKFFLSIWHVVGHLRTKNQIWVIQIIKNKVRVSWRIASDVHLELHPLSLFQLEK